MGVFKDYSTIVIIIFFCALVCDLISAVLAIYAMSVDVKWNSWLRNGISNENSNASRDFQDLGVDRLSHRVPLQVIFILAMIVMFGMTIVIFMYRAHKRNIISLITFFFVLVCLIFIPALELISTFEIDSSYSRYIDLEGWGPSLKALRTCSNSKGPLKENSNSTRGKAEAMDEEDDEEFRKHGMCQEFVVKIIAAVFAFIGIFLILLLAYWGSFVSPEYKSKVSSRNLGQQGQQRGGEGEEGDEDYDQDGSSGSNLHGDDEDLNNEGSGSNFSFSSSFSSAPTTSQDDDLFDGGFGGGHGGAHGGSTPSLFGSSSGGSSDEFGSTDFETSPMSLSRSDLMLTSSSSHPTSAASSSGMLFSRSKSNPSIFGGIRPRSRRWGDLADDDEAPPSPPPPTPSLLEYSSEQKSRKSSDKSRNSKENQGQSADEQKSRKSGDLKSKKSKKSSESPKEHDDKDQDGAKQKPKKKKKKGKPHSKNSPMFYDKFVETPQHSLNSTSSNSKADVAGHPRKTSHPKPHKK